LRLRHLAEDSMIAKRPLSESRKAIREEAIQTLKKLDYDPEVYRRVEALVGSLADTLEARPSASSLPM
jgi:hypothetical protein